MKWNVWNLTTEEWASYKSVGSKAVAETMLVNCRVEAERRKLKHKFEVRRVLTVLEQHGTRLVKLKPSMIWEVAMQDFARRDHNLSAGLADIKPYAFHRKHVASAESANDILRAAIAEPELGRASGKRNTRLLYSDVELLKAALK